uniref:Uncharacterized protein n=1 Tax=Anguilla anguilla TaxID=7936 RepID=A0A0E9QX05_ANGAN
MMRLPQLRHYLEQAIHLSGSAYH